MKDFFRDYGFVKKDNDWYHRGFVFLRFKKNQIEVKTINEGNKSIFFNHNDMSLIMSYYKNLL